MPWPQQPPQPPYPPTGGGTAWPAAGPGNPDATPARDVPRLPDGTPAQGVPRFPGGTPARGVPRFPDGTPAQGVPRFPDGTPARGVPRLPEGTPARGVPRFPGGTPGAGAPGGGFGDAPTPSHGVPPVRGGHPQQPETAPGRGGPRSGPEGGAGRGGPHGAPQGPGPSGRPARGRTGLPIPRQRQASPDGPRPEYVRAFDENTAYADTADDDGVFTRRRPVPARGAGRDGAGPYGTGRDGTGRDGAASPAPASVADRSAEAGEQAYPQDAGAGRAGTKGKAVKGRTFTGIAAAAVTTVLAVVVAGQVADGRDADGVQSQAAGGSERTSKDAASRGDNRPTPSDTPTATALTYDQKMARIYPLEADLRGSGKFDAVGGFDKAPGTGRKYTYRVDVEKGLGLDGELFAQAVQKTLNDDRSWAHGGGRTFERISSGQPDFVITLASPGTTDEWCLKSGLDITVDNVSCDSAATDRVMINAYRWAQGSETYGDDKIHSYRQMLINHEVGHRLGFNHVTCTEDGALAPVMQQQTKFLDHDGIHCRPNPWAYPGD
ncbi:DUF3152 domain-containing protein [Streptomyces minutiscleroticus]|nr:DUF3152 domain-containing protein [Streptomyces minutiscleroticus]